MGNGDECGLTFFDSSEWGLMGMNNQGEGIIHPHSYPYFPDIIHSHSSPLIPFRMNRRKLISIHPNYPFIHHVLKTDYYKFLKYRDTLWDESVMIGGGARAETWHEFFSLGMKHSNFFGSLAGEAVILFSCFCPPPDY